MSEPMRKMRTPEAWIGKRVDHLDYEYSMLIWIEYDKCDDCQCLYRVVDLHSLLWPMSEADWKLQKGVGVEEAESFCLDCLGHIEEQADRIDATWRERHGYY